MTGQNFELIFNVNIWPIYPDQLPTSFSLKMHINLLKKK